ncbi:MAG: EAL domain-containing protein [Gallionella sp.]|nr:EAL domain-containing protein [Gallionella sp.]MDD4946479.1 EAL domain-containing protein [Gallionella sp.]
MTNQPRYLSIRWKIIILAAIVLGLTSLLFIWQQHEFQSNELKMQQAEFREHSRIILENLLQSQTNQIRMLGELLLEQPGIADNLLHKRAAALAQSVQAISDELGFAQNILAVVFFDEQQKIQSVWGDTLYEEDVLPLAGLASNHATSRISLFCKQICARQISLPIYFQGRMVGSVSMVVGLGQLQNDLHALTQADVVVLKGRNQDERAPLGGMSVIFNTGQFSRELLSAAQNDDHWLDGLLQLQQAGQIYQLFMIHSQQFGGNALHFLLIRNITNSVQLVDYKSNKIIISGLLVFMLALCILYLMLRPTVARFSHLIKILPMLGNEPRDYTQLRDAYAVRPAGMALGRIWRDEADDLETMAITLTARLEQLNEDSLHHLESLSVHSNQLKKERDFISSLLDTAPVLILSYGEDGSIQLANAQATHASGVTDLVGKNFAELFIGISQHDFATEMAEIKSGNVHHLESTLTNQDGRKHNLLWFSSRLPVGMADTPIYLSVGMDITEHKQNEARIHHMAFYDMLTQLPNRRMLLDVMRHAMLACGEEKLYCAIIFVDLDNFKAINDGRGRNIGDQILVEIAKRLRSSVREFDTVAHLGVDEFVILLEELSGDLELAAAQSRVIGEKLCRAVSQPVVLHDHTYHLTCSAGISMFIGNELTTEAALRQANIAMTHAKTSGRNTLRFFDPEMQLKLEARATLEVDLRRAIAGKQFQLFYQAQSNTERQPLGAEVLLRWLHPTHGLISPAQFIPFAEESELMQPLGQWLLETACAQLKSWETDELTASLQLAVNVSARQFHQPDFVEQVLNTLAKTGAPPSRIKLELTESMVLENIQDAVSKMLALKKIGVQFSIDDFGTAYSSLSYLTQLPLDQLKIDQSFVRNIGISNSDDIVVQTIINMANNLGMQVIAEGVETEVQFQFLKESGCNTFQGYLFSKPLALGEFIDYLNRLKGDSA